jgi:soluble lytic murein transglycosylase
MPKTKSRIRFAVVLSLILSSLLTVSVLISSPEPDGTLVVRSEGAWRHHSPTLSRNLYTEAAEALRRGNLQEARQELDQIAAEHPNQAAQARVVAGLYAHEAGDAELAERILSTAPAAGGPLEDWRLLLLARSQAERDEPELARATYDRLIAGQTESPLRPLAFLESAKLAADGDRLHDALGLIEKAREAGIDGQAAEDLDSLAWEIGHKLDEEEVLRAAGRRVLVVDPLSAEAVQVVRTFRALDGDLDWSSILSPEEILRRAQSFIEGDNTQAAISTLKEIPEEQRGFDWYLTKARALTQNGSGREALAVLGDLKPSGAAERAALEWERVLATAEMGRPAAAAVYLAKLVNSSSPLNISREALRHLYADFLDAGYFQPALETLRLLRRIDPADETGAADLWERGWREYRRGNRTGAIGYWSELEDLYPEDGDAQRGRYWKARAFEELGQKERARDLYRDLVASSDTSDFYSRQALGRLGEIPQTSGTALAQAPAEWPAEPELQRAKLLIDLGLDDLASRELELLADEADRRDVLALKGIILCRQGEQRNGIVLLREAFPMLGGPYQANVPAEVLFAYYPLEYGDQIRTFAREAGVPAHLVAAVIRQESAFDPRATSPVGARGLMQLMPATAREIAKKEGVSYWPDRLYDPALSVRFGAIYLGELLDRFDGNVELAIAGYNGGPNRIRRLWKESGPHAELDDFLETLDIDESRNYVKRVLVLADSYRQLYPSLG